MSRVRMLIWTPLNPAELQKAMHGANVGPAALVPVQSGTVLLPSTGIRLAEAALMAMRVRKIAGRSALVLWNAEAAACYPFTKTTALGRAWYWGSHDEAMRLLAEAKQAGPIGRLLDRLVGRVMDQRESEKYLGTNADKFVALLPEADRGEVLACLRDHTAGVGAVPRFLRVFGLPDVAQVAELVEQGRADAWLEPLAPPRVPSWPKALLVPMFVLLMLAILMFELPVLVFVGIWLLGTALIFGTTLVLTRQLVARKPINTVLPVIPVTQGAAPTEQG